MFCDTVYFTLVIVQLHRIVSDLDASIFHKLFTSGGRHYGISSYSIFLYVS